MRPHFVPLVLAILVGFSGSSDGFFGGCQGPGNGWGDYSNCGYASSLWSGFCAQGQGCGAGCCAPSYAYGIDGWGPGCNYGTGLAGCFTRNGAGAGLLGKFGGGCGGGGCGGGACGGGCGQPGFAGPGFGGPGFGPGAAFSLAPETRAVGYGGAWFGGFGTPGCGCGPKCGGGCGGGLGGLFGGLRNRIGQQSWIGGGPLDSYGLVGGFPQSGINYQAVPVDNTWDGTVVNDMMMSEPTAAEAPVNPGCGGETAPAFDATTTLRDSEFNGEAAFSGESSPVTDDVEME